LNTSFSIFPLGDSAVTLDLGPLIDEQLNNKALAIGRWLRAHAFRGLRDILVAYSSVTIFYDPIEMITEVPGCRRDGIYNYVKGLLEKAWAVTGSPDGISVTKELTRIPVCYGGMHGPDLEELSAIKKMPQEDIVRLHCSLIYRVYMIGFLPGFPYLGKVDARLETGRKQRPAPVKAGGVGIAGSQTGIYPVSSPGGWQIIGRTPFKLFDPAATPPVTLAIGDKVQFYPIGPEEFRSACPG
jgi:inhibitor of KinA